MTAMSDENLENPGWVYTTFPSVEFKNNFAADLLQYVQGGIEWDEVVDNLVEDWAYEKEALNE